MFREDFHYRRKRISELCRNHFKRASYSLLRGIAPTSSLNSMMAEKVEKYKNRLMYPEEVCSFGNLNPDKTFYVVRVMPQPIPAGLFANFLYVAGQIYNANERGMIPIVDMENYDVMFPKNKPKNTPKNSWELFFEQPTDIPLEEVYRSKNVILSCGYDWWKAFGFGEPSRTVEKYHAMISRQMRFNAATSKFIDDAWNKLKGGGEILSVMSRGTDYRIKKPKDHPIQPDPEFLLDKAIDMMSKYGIKRCFLKTEEKKVNDMFATALGDAFISLERSYYDAFEEVSDKMWMTDYFSKVHDKQNAAHRAMLEYIRNVAISSRCDYLLTGINCGSRAALLLNGGQYKEAVMIDLGKY